MIKAIVRSSKAKRLICMASSCSGIMWVKAQTTSLDITSKWTAMRSKPVEEEFSSLKNASEDELRPAIRIKWQWKRVLATSQTMLCRSSATGFWPRVHFSISSYTLSSQTEHPEFVNQLVLTNKLFNRVPRGPSQHQLCHLGCSLPLLGARGHKRRFEKRRSSSFNSFTVLIGCCNGHPFTKLLCRSWSFVSIRKGRKCCECQAQLACCSWVAIALSALNNSTGYELLRPFCIRILAKKPTGKHESLKGQQASKLDERALGAVKQLPLTEQLRAAEQPQGAKEPWVNSFGTLPWCATAHVTYPDAQQGRTGGQHALYKGALFLVRELRSARISISTSKAVMIGKRLESRCKSFPTDMADSQDQAIFTVRSTWRCPELQNWH